MSPSPPLTIEDVSYSYDRTCALKDVSFQLTSGRFTALLGPNGAGKTTLFALVTRLLESRKGRVLIDGMDIRSGASALAPLGIVFQQPTLDLDLTVRQNLRYFASLQGLTEPDARIEEELSRLGMAERAGERVRKLNGGHRRRVEIARAMLHRPSLLLLDEPTVGLDVESRQRIVDHVHDLAAKDGIAVLWATHLIDEIRDSDDLIVLHQGAIAAQGLAGEVRQEAGAADLREAFSRLTDSRSVSGAVA